MSHSKNFTPDKTQSRSLDHILRAGQKVLKPSPTAGLDARLLMQFAASLSHEQLILQADQPLRAGIEEKFKQLIARRRQGTPLDAITGRREFWSLDFLVNENVLTPRPESELIIELALHHFSEQTAPLNILDLGTGSGCLAISLLTERRNAKAIAIDLSQEALDVATQNATRHGVEKRLTLKRQDFAQKLTGPFDLIVSNPPYVADGADLPKEVLDHDPGLALFGGYDGLGAYRAIAPWILTALAPNGLALFEIGAGQAAQVRALFASGDGPESLKPDIQCHQDLASIERVVAIRKP